MAEQLTQALEKGNIIIGAKRALKFLRANKISHIYLSSNVSSAFEEDITYYANLTNIPVEKLKTDNEDLAVMCKKPFLVNVIAVTK